MSRRRKRRGADRPVSRRHLDRAVERLRQDLVHTILWATIDPEPTDLLSPDQVEARVHGYPKRER